MTPIWLRSSRICLLVLLLLKATASSQQCNDPNNNHVVVELDSDSPKAGVRRQVVEVGDTIYWYQPKNNLTSMVYVVVPSAICDPSYPLPAAGQCHIKTGTGAANYPYSYCLSNESAPPDASCTTVVTHEIRVRAPKSEDGDNFLIGDAHLELKADGEVNHIILDENSCIHWRDKDHNKLFVGFSSNKPTCFPKDSTTGVESCSIPARSPKTKKKDADYALCSVGTSCDPTIHILGSGNSFDGAHKKEDLLSRILDHIVAIISTLVILVMIMTAVYMSRRRAR